MPSAKDGLRVPSYRRHKPSGQAVVTLSGKDFYLGPWNTRANQAEYDRLIGKCCDTNTYRRAIHRAVDLANRQLARQNTELPKDQQVELLPRWAPNQLRHSAATEIRRQFGLEAAQVALGHSQADVTQIYAERDLTLAVEIMRKIG